MLDEPIRKGLVQIARAICDAQRKHDIMLIEQMCSPDGRCIFLDLNGNVNVNFCPYHTAAKRLWNSYTKPQFEFEITPQDVETARRIAAKMKEESPHVS